MSTSIKEFMMPQPGDEIIEDENQLFSEGGEDELEDEAEVNQK